MKKPHWYALGIVVAGFLLLAGCSGSEPSQQSTPDSRTDTPTDAGSTAAQSMAPSSSPRTSTMSISHRVRILSPFFRVRDLLMLAIVNLPRST